jgi:hypothetical protein
MTKKQFLVMLSACGLVLVGIAIPPRWFGVGHVTATPATHAWTVKDVTKDVHFGSAPPTGAILIADGKGIARWTAPTTVDHGARDEEIKRACREYLHDETPGNLPNRDVDEHLGLKLPLPTWPVPSDGGSDW